MIRKFKKIFLTLAFSVLPLCSFCQDPQEEEALKKFNEAIDKQVDQLALSLDLEDWQTFYIDSILRHDYSAMREEVQKLNKARVANGDIYQQVQDKWTEQVYNSFHKVLNESQWTKYLKTGAARDKKARDKRAAKAAENK